MAWLLMDTTDAISWAPSEANSFWCGLKQCDVTGKERQRGHHTAAGQQQGPSLGCPWSACSPDPPSQAQHPQPCTTPTAFWTSLPEWDLDLAQLLPFKEEKNLRRHIPGASKGARACDGFTGSAPPSGRSQCPPSTSVMSSLTLFSHSVSSHSAHFCYEISRVPAVHSVIVLGS